MKRRLFSAVLCLLLLLCIPLSAFAMLQDIQYVVDNADILSDSEHIELDSIADRLSRTYDIDVLIMTVDFLAGKTAQEYAESLYDRTDANWSGGYWATENAILFLLAMDEREWYISTAGNAIYVFTDYGLDVLGDSVIPYLSEGEYFEGFYTYLNLLPDYFDAYESGSPIDGYTENDYYAERSEVVYYEDQNQINWILSVAIGLIAALISILIMIGAMNTKRQQYSAGDYLRPGTYQLKRHSDMFLYSNVTKVRRQENNTHSGGSSVHRGSGGSHHGGRGGKF